MAGQIEARILVIDDEPGVRMVLERMLQRLGYDVLSAMSGRKALQMLQAEEGLDLVVLDLGLPDMTGDQVLEGMRELGVKAPVLISSGRSAEELDDRLAANDAVAGVLRKPFRLPDLQEAVTSCLASGSGA